MTIAKNVMLPILGLGMVAAVLPAQAAEDAVLFKIHDIVPVKNADGLVTSCDLGATFYNRSDKEVSNSSLRLVWQDEVVAETIDQEQRNDRESRRLKRTNVARYKTSDFNTKDISLSLKLPPLKPHQQISLKSKINTDRCFLLLNEMEINVSSCTINGASTKSGQNNSSKECSDLFQFVSVKNPEYYSEFKNISVEDQLTQEQALNESRKQELLNLYNDSMNSINQLTSNLEDIKE